LFLAFWISSCAHSGPNISLCILDPPHHGFQCASKKKQWFSSFEESKLVCIDPNLAESWLKACRQGELDPIILCRITFNFIGLDCYGIGDGFFIPIEEADNFICISEHDLTRIKQRCKK
jgi:hypothetical protein